MSNKIALEALTDAKAAYEAWGNGTKKIDAALAALEAMEAMEAGGWLPISEAPRGRKVLAGYKNKLGNWRTVTARYYLPQTLLLEDDRDDLDDDGYAPEGWYEESETQNAILPIEEPPTHFQPLPTPPKD